MLAKSVRRRRGKILEGKDVVRIDGWRLRSILSVWVRNLHIGGRHLRSCFFPNERAKRILFHGIEIGPIRIPGLHLILSPTLRQ